MRLIDADAFWEQFAYGEKMLEEMARVLPTEVSKAVLEMYKELKERLDASPTIDAVPVEKYVPERNVGEWDMFDLITSAYYGKTMYFKQDNGIVYSRYSCKYMSVDEAIREFLALIGDIE